MTSDPPVSLPALPARRRLLLATAAGGVAALAPFPFRPALADAMDNIKLDSPEMREADITRAEAEAVLRAAAARGKPADFRRRRLSGLDLAGLSLRRADLRWARLNYANLQGADLSGAVLDSAWLAGADLSGANLSRASAQSAQMPKANLRGADLSGARIVANLARADLRRARAPAANFAPDMRNQSMGLVRLVLTNADADDADFSGANLDWADAEFASFRRGDFRGASFRRAKLGGADFTAAQVAGMDVLGANLDSAVLVQLRGEPANLDKARKLNRAWRD